MLLIRLRHSTDMVQTWCRPGPEQADLVKTWLRHTRLDLNQVSIRSRFEESSREYKTDSILGSVLLMHKKILPKATKVPRILA